MKSQKAQHEIAGFVLIVVVVTVIGLVFLMLMIGRGEIKKTNSLEVSNLLQASMHYTTDCAVDYATSFVPQYEDGQDLIKECYYSRIGHRSSKCLDGRAVCDALNSTLKNIIESSLYVHEDSPNKAYQLEIFYNESGYDEILRINLGAFSNCSSRYLGSHSIHSADFEFGSPIEIKLEVCKG